MNRNDSDYVPVALVRRPLFGGEGMLRDYSSTIAARTLKDPRFQTRYSQESPESLRLIAEDGAQNLLIQKIQDYRMEYTYDAQNDCGVLFVRSESERQKAIARLPSLAKSIGDLCGRKLRYDIADAVTGVED